jgi:Ca-activated chloride channel homolog
VPHQRADDQSVGGNLQSLDLRAAAVLLLGFCSVSFAEPGDTPIPSYRMDVSEVRVTFSVTDQNNHEIATLQASDFAVVDQDLVIRELRSFNRAEFTDLEVVVLVDASGSTSKQLSEEVADVAQLIDHTAGVPEGNFSIVSFKGQRPTIVCAGNCRASQLAQELPMHSGGLTPLFDSIVFAAQLLSEHAGPHAKKALVLLSDGDDTISWHTSRDVLEAALAREVQIYAVDSGSSSAGEAILHNFADATGGRYYTMPESNKVAPAVLEDFHASYTVAYRLPSREIGFHSLRILPRRNLNLNFHCRSGYYYRTNSP